MSERGRTVREAMAVALEGLADPHEIAIVDAVAMREYLRDWIKGYAKFRGVIIDNQDVDDEIVDIIAMLRNGGNV